MPGLAGFTTSNGYIESPEKILKEMLRYQNSGNTEYSIENFNREYVHSGMTTLKQRAKDETYLKSSGIHVWVEGEVVEIESDFVANGGADTELPTEFVKTAIQENDLERLSQINGIYSAVVYDEKNKVVHLITDRFGLSNLHWSIINGEFIWCSYVKSFLAYPKIELTIDNDSLEDFLNIGWILGDKTWFKEVNIVPAATILSWDISRKKLSKQKYWQWADHNTHNSAIDMNQAIEELGYLVKRAVEKCSYLETEIGITLSGGLDSRAILAAIPPEKNVKSISFGIRDCEDLRIAREVAAVRGSKHFEILVDADNWFNSRIKGVWWTDGRKDIMHMEILAAYEKAANIGIEVIFDGAGGGLLKGSYCSIGDDIVGYLNSEFKCNITYNSGLASRVKEYYSKLGSPYVFLTDSRIRSMSNYGPRLSSMYGIRYKLPLMENKLQEKIVSYSCVVHGRSKLYKKMLCETFPEYYRKIRYQKTGVPLETSPLISAVTRNLNRVKYRTLNELRRVGVNYVDKRFPTHSASWLRSNPAKQIAEQLLFNKSSMIGNYIEQRYVESVLREHLEGKDNIHTVGRYMTVEIMLQQFLAGNLRP